MIRIRLKELIDFATTQSPYQDANKGWINNDVYLKLGDSANSNRKTEVANIAIFWAPINKIISLLFLIIISASILVFLASAYNHNKINLPSRIQPQIQSFNGRETSNKQLELDANKQESQLNNIDSSTEPKKQTASKPEAASINIVAKEIKPMINPLQPKSH